MYSDYQELLKDGSIDVVHVCTPNVVHAPITVAAFAAGKHVMCEKPMAHNTEAGDLGEIYFAKAHAIRRRAVPTWGGLQDKEQQGGGSLIDIGIHALDITLWMKKNSCHIFASGIGCIPFRYSEGVC